MKDDKYVFYIVSEMNTVGNSSGEKCHLVKKNKKYRRKSFAAGGTGGLNLAICGTNNYFK